MICFKLNRSTTKHHISFESMDSYFISESITIFYSLSDFYWSFDWSTTVRLFVEFQLWASITIFKFWATPSLTILIYTFKQINLSNLQFFFETFDFKSLNLNNNHSLFLIIDPCRIWNEFFSCLKLYWKLVRSKSPIIAITTITIVQWALDFTENLIWIFVQISQRFS